MDLARARGAKDVPLMYALPAAAWQHAPALTDFLLNPQENIFQNYPPQGWTQPCHTLLSRQQSIIFWNLSEQP